MTVNVLILCTHNAARSVLAEAMLNHWALKLARNVQAFSAGSAPSGQVHPHALAVLRRAEVDASALRSKSWDEFRTAGAPRIDVVITLGDGAAATACPVWPGNPVKLHWALPDPCSLPEAQQPPAFEKARQALSNRMLQLLELPLAGMDNAQREKALGGIVVA